MIEFEVTFVVRVNEADTNSPYDPKNAKDFHSSILVKCYPIQRDIENRLLENNVQFKRIGVMLQTIKQSKP